MFVTSAMNVFVTAALFVVILCCGALGSSHDTGDVASLLDRMKAQEILNQELTTKLLRHEDKITQQTNFNQDLTTKLLRHEDKITQQTNFNQDLKTKLLQQEHFNRELRTRLARQDGTLLQQGRLIHQLRSVVAASRASAAVSRASATVSRASATVSPALDTVSRASATASRASATVSPASATASRASAAVSRASATVSRASATVSRASAWADKAPASRRVNAVDVMGGPEPGTPDSRADTAVPGRIVAKHSHSIHNVTKPSAAGHNAAKQPDSGHNVVKRSDDGGPLEAVVNQISQRVTEMGAALQALKAQTTSDLNALKAQTTSDLNALKAQTTADVQTLQTSDRQQDQNIHDARTSTFVRWGSSTCGSSSSLVYSGIVGGSWFDATGAATNYLCLTLSPVPSQRAPPPGQNFARLYGAEYETQDSHQEKDPLCAVCRAAFSTTVMVPGTDACSQGWHRHYSGFLMATRYGHAGGTQFICVDPAMESAPHGDANEDGRTLYYTVTRCGSLPCGPYVNNKVVTCAVCSM